MRALFFAAIAAATVTVTTGFQSSQAEAAGCVRGGVGGVGGVGCAGPRAPRAGVVAPRDRMGEVAPRSRGFGR